MAAAQERGRGQEIESESPASRQPAQAARSTASRPTAGDGSEKTPSPYSPPRSPFASRRPRASSVVRYSPADPAAGCHHPARAAGGIQAPKKARRSPAIALDDARVLARHGSDALLHLRLDEVSHLVVVAPASIASRQIASTSARLGMSVEVCRRHRTPRRGSSRAARPGLPHPLGGDGPVVRRQFRRWRRGQHVPRPGIRTPPTSPVKIRPSSGSQ